MHITICYGSQSSHDGLYQKPVARVSSHFVKLDAGTVLGKSFTSIKYTLLSELFESTS